MQVRQELVKARDPCKVSTMQLAEASSLIKKAVLRMNEAYGRPVFDEWAIITLRAIQGTIHEYAGPRHAGFQSHFLENLVPLREEMNRGDLDNGDFAFAREATGADFDAFIVLGNEVYLLLNHTEKDMETITRDPMWKKAQPTFVNLCERFRHNALEI